MSYTDSEENSINSEVGEVVSEEENEFREDVIKASIREAESETLKKLLQDSKSRSWSLDFYRYGSTPLTLAAEIGHYKICDLLLKHDPNLVNKVNHPFSCLSLFHNSLHGVLFSFQIA